MFGNSKGLIFILDLIAAVAVITIALIFIVQVKPENTLKQQNDLVYLEAQNYLMHVPLTNTYDINKNYVCRNYTKLYIATLNTMVSEDKNICTNVIG